MSSLLKYKTLRQLRIPVWPWRKLNPKHTAWMAKEVRRAKKKVTKPLVPRPPKTPTFYGMTLLRILKTVYGPSNTSTFVNLFSKAKKTSVPSLQAFLQLLEMRLDVILYRARFATSYLQLHQWIAHGKVCVNGQVVTTKGRLLSPGDVVSIHPQAVSSVEESMRTFWAHAPLSQPTPTTFCPRRKLVRREAFVRDQSGRLVKTLLHASTLKTKKNKVSSLWWKPTHLEINYQTLHLVVLWHPQTLLLPTILKSTHLKAAVAR